MPWCATCSRYLAPATVRPDGMCPTCATPVQPGGARPAGDRVEPTAGDEPLPSLPWHFKALVGMLAVYLGYRFYEMGEWLLRRL